GIALGGEADLAGAAVGAARDDAVGGHGGLAGLDLEGDHVPDPDLLGGGRLDDHERAGRIGGAHRAGEDAQRHPTHGGGHGDGDRAERQHEEQDAQADSVQQRAGHLATAARAAWDHLVPLRPSTSSSSPATISPIATTPTTVRVNPVTASGPGDGAESSCPGAAVAGMVTAGDEGTPDNSSSAPPATASRNPRARSRPTAVDCAPQLSVVGARSIVTRTRVACP